MAERRLQQLEERVDFLRKEAEAFKQQSYQQADLLRDLVPALSRLGHAANDSTIDAARRLSRGVSENSQNVDTIRQLANEFLSIYRRALNADELQPHDLAWRLDVAAVLDQLFPDGAPRDLAARRLRAGDPAAEALAPLAEALSRNRVSDAASERLADMLSTLPLDKAAFAQAQALGAKLRDQRLELAELERVLDEFAVLLEQALQKLIARDKQMRHLVWHLGSELGVVESFLGALSQRDETSLSNALAVQRAVCDESVDIVSIFDHSDSLAEVRDHVVARARAIRSRMNQYADAARVAREESARHAQVLSEKMTNLESELCQTREALAEAHNTASHDFLTGLYNRRAFEDAMKSWLDGATRSGELYCVIWDIDHFKQVNDTHGHDVGDAVLRQTATVLRERTGDGDMSARLGGEEFVSVIRSVDHHVLLQWAESVRQHISLLEHEIETGHLSVTVSCGIAAYMRGDSLPSIMVRADRALYDAKAQGRNRCIVSS
ncbi:MAG: GGDEF domain-containing protein [Pseudomonadota bacterium]